MSFPPIMQPRTNYRSSNNGGGSERNNSSSTNNGGGFQTPPPQFQQLASNSNRGMKLPSLTIPGSPSLSTASSTDFNSSTTIVSNSDSSGNLIPPPVPYNPGESTPSSAASELAKSGYFSAELAAAMDSNTSMNGSTLIPTDNSSSSFGGNYYHHHSRNPSTTSDGCPPLDIDSLDEDGWRQVARQGDIVELGRLGEGFGGSVKRCRLRHGKTVFALKEITTNPNPDIQKQILRELQFNRKCNSPNIVKYYGTFLNEDTANIFIAMEYCGGGSLDAIYKRVKSRGGRIGEKVLGKIAEGVLTGLSYLHDRKIIHRDIKPQNILLDETGQVKLCDFGVSGEVVNSLATTFTGTSYYMAPERIQGQPYSVTSDVWSLGLTIMEVAQHRFPFLPEGDEHQGEPLMPIELLTFIVNMPAPQLKDEPEEGIKWSESFRHFLSCCLEKDSKKRASPRQILEHPWLQGQRTKKVKMDRFVQECWS